MNTVLIYLTGLLLNTRKLLYRKKAGIRKKNLLLNQKKWPYLEAGIRGRATIICVHGFGSSKDEFVGIMRHFKSKYHLLAPDMPGSGENPIDEKETYNVATLVTKLDSFLRHLGIGSFHLIGSSMGGFITAYYAALFPEKIKSLTLIDAAGFETPQLSPFWRHYLSTGQNLLIYDTPEGFKEAMSFVHEKPPRIPGFSIRYFVAEARKKNRTLNKLFNDLLSMEFNPLLDKLSSIEAETLILWGEKDKVIDVSAIPIFQHHIRNTKTKVFPGVGHAPHIADLKKVVSEIDEFLAHLGNPR
ncbi:MAG: alpha/beta hydrolase [Spirochaetota bacterium]